MMPMVLQEPGELGCPGVSLCMQTQPVLQDESVEEGFKELKIALALQPEPCEHEEQPQKSLPTRHSLL